MSVDTKIYLPSDVRSLDVATAVGVLAGLPVVRKTFGWVVSGLTLTPLMGTTYALEGPMVDGSINHQFSVYFENDTFLGHDRLIMVSSTPFWVAIGRRLITFFGGALLYADCSGEDANQYYIRKWQYPREIDDEGCLELSRRISTLTPLTPEELQAAAQFAYYNSKGK